MLAGGKRMKATLHAIGLLLIVVWLVLWLAVKITFAAVHVLLLLGIAMIVIGLMSRSSHSTA
jgi:hypothetical protein